MLEKRIREKLSLFAKRIATFMLIADHQGADTKSVQHT